MRQLKSLLAILQAMLELVPITLVIVIIAALIAIPIGKIKRKITPKKSEKRKSAKARK